MAATRARGRGRIGGPRGSAKPRGRGKAGGSAAARANAEAGAEYNAPIREGREAIKGSRKRSQNLASWYRQLASDYQGAQNQGAAALGSVENATSQQLAEAGARSSADLSALAAQDASLANTIKGPTDTQGLAQIAQAAQAAGQARVDQAKLAPSEQANFVARLGSDKIAARLGGIEARKEEAQRRDKLKADLTAQRTSKAQARTVDLSKIREASRAAAIEIAKLRLAQKEARTNAQQAAATAALARAESAFKHQQAAITNAQEQQRIQISRTNAKISAKNARTSARSQRATAKHYAHENRGGLTPSERHAKKEDLRNAAVEATNLYKAAKKPPKSNEDWAAFTHLVAEQSEISPAAAAKAVEHLRQALAARAQVHNQRLHQGKIPGH